ncbi:hypothetical protein NON00_02735 [Roseomonas sp. GC11]|uniref:hypothetical protein n=1 Tax=Roseomonas sp. GC11 TaxID=2950546 RepID=UPI00210F1599|nr:hypothetical protein [Roseomonas sp. GC11]MCQ4158843.1 hypothetical protein [Roseomonas sp. GC11]
MCEPILAPRLSEADITSLTLALRHAEGDWSIFPHVDSDGGITLMLTPRAWDGTDSAFMVQRGQLGLEVLLSDGDDILPLGVVQEAGAALPLLLDAVA